MNLKKRKIGLTFWFLMFSIISVGVVAASLFSQIQEKDIDLSDLREVQILNSGTLEKPVIQSEKTKTETEQDFF